MAERLALFTIPPHRAFADALVAGLRRRAGEDPLALARATVLLPNNRAVRAVTDAFVRASGGGLLLPRLVALGDPEAGDAIGVALDPADAQGDFGPIPPAVDPYRRRLTLARLVQAERAAAGQPVEAAEAVRLAGELARTLDQLLAEGVAPAKLRDLELKEALSEHWARALSTFSVVLDRWPAELARLGCIDAADRRARLLDRVEARWRESPPDGLICAAGVTDSAPAMARLLRRVAELPRGLVVFAGLDLAMPDEEWDALGPFPPDERRRAIETHPQFHLKLQLDRIGAGRGEVATWQAKYQWGGSERDADPARARAIANALAPAAFTGKWTGLPAADRRLGGVEAAELATPAEEAQAIALALREALETPGRTAALVTPDRALARRVAAHCGRWGIALDDSAGRPLSILPPGTLLLALAEAAAQRWAPLPLLALLKHPLARAGEGRLAWLDEVRALDRKLRGPRPPPGLAGIGGALGGRQAGFWGEVEALLAPVERAFGDGAQPLAELVACLRGAAQALCGDALWTGPAGRAAAEFLASLEAEAPHGPATVEPEGLAPLLRTLLDEEAVRPPQGGHPRLAIYGLIEARLQSADLMILGGLNEGVWPGRPAPDPWLAPPIRAALGLPGLERRIGVAAHDFAQGLGAPAVLVTRARRDASTPTLASRLWLRLEAMAGAGFRRAAALEGWARALDAAPGEPQPAPRPAPRPPASLRPKRISVTEVDRLKADPYALYARRILDLAALEPVDAEPSPAWRGSEVHAILQKWFEEDGCAPDALVARGRAVLGDTRIHPLLRALWAPRLVEAIDWIDREVAKDRQDGRRIISVERQGEIDIAGVRLRGRYDRIDRCADGGLAVIDYKTGKAPSPLAVREGYSQQLGLLGLIAERGGFAEADGTAIAFEYWSLTKKGDSFGNRSSPCDPTGAKDKIVTAEFTAVAARNFADAAGRWLTGDEAFTAKLHPEHAPYGDYDQLMRLDEWYGRE